MRDDEFNKMFKQSQSYVQRTMLIYAFASLLWFLIATGIVAGAVYLLLRVCGVV